jgi:hypothetical protein
MTESMQSQAVTLPSSTLKSIASQLVGVWRLVSYTEEQNGREDSFPFGPEPEGFLIYTPDGFVSAQLMKPGRSLFPSQDWRAGTPDEYQQAGIGYIAYCGVYEVDEENLTVTHLPSVALVPNLILKGQLRSITLSGDRLTLCTVGVPVTNGPSVTSRLEWQRTGRKQGSVAKNRGLAD